jgi:hypothetical protein
VKVVGDFRLELRLSNGMKIERDFSRFAERAQGVLVPLRDLKFFRRAKAKDGTVQWPGELDLCPDVIIWGRGSSGKPARNAMYH